MYRELFCLYFFLLTSVIIADHPDIPYMKLKLTTSKDIVTCDQSKEKNYSIIAFEGEPLLIFIEYDTLLYSVKCYDEKANATVFLNTMHIDSKKTIEVLNITSIMGGKWICKISVKPNNKPNKRVKTVVCYIKVHVRLKYAHHILRVNYMPMKPTRESINTRDFDHYVEYKYKNGDKVDIFCYNAYDPLEECTIDMKYYYEELKDHILELKSPKVVQSNIELHLNHSGSFIDCIYTCKKDYQIQRMKFVSSNDFTNDIKLNINQQEARIHMDNVFKFMGQWNIYLHFQIFQNEYFNIICGEYSKFYECNHFCDYRLPTICKKWAFKDKVTCITHYIHNIDHFEIVLRVQRIYETTDTGFQHLSLNLPNNNTVMNFLSEKERVIYYAFDDSNEIEVSCIRKEMPGQKTYISTTKKFNADRKINKLTDKLKMSHHDVYTCALYKSSRKFHSKILYKITVIFVQKEIDEIMMTTNDPGIIETTEMTVTDSSVINTPGIIDTTEMTVMDSSVIKTPGTNHMTIYFIFLAVVLLIIFACTSYRCYRKLEANENQSVNVVDSSAAINQDSELKQALELRNLSLVNKEISNGHQYSAASDRNKYDYNHSHDYAEVIYKSNKYDYVDTAYNPHQYDYVNPAYNPHQYDYVSPAYDPKAQVPILKIKKEDNSVSRNSNNRKNV